MNQEQFRKRCPNSSFICNARLREHKFAIVCEDDPESTASGFATVLPQEGGVVHGVLCALTPKDEETLDSREDVLKGDYLKGWLDVVTERDTVKALVYINKLTKEGSPKDKDYLPKIVEGAQSRGLPLAYITEIKDWKEGPVSSEQK